LAKSKFKVRGSEIGFENSDFKFQMSESPHYYGLEWEILHGI